MAQSPRVAWLTDDTRLYGLFACNDAMIASEKRSGWGGIRTHGTVTRTAVFKTAAFVHSATHPACHDALFCSVFLPSPGSRHAPKLILATRYSSVQHAPTWVSDNSQPSSSEAMSASHSTKAKAFKKPRKDFPLISHATFKRAKAIVKTTASVFVNRTRRRGGDRVVYQDSLGRHNPRTRYDSFPECRYPFGYRCV